MVRRKRGQQKRIRRIDIGKRNGIYEVLYLDENGMSILAKSKNPDTALKKAKKFQRDIDSGKLLKEDSSVWKY